MGVVIMSIDAIANNIAAVLLDVYSVREPATRQPRLFYCTATMTLL